MNKQILMFVLLCLLAACNSEKTNINTTNLAGNQKGNPKVLTSCKEELPSPNLQRILDWLSVKQDYQHEAMPNLLVATNFWEEEKYGQLKAINQCSYKVERVYGVAGKVPKYQNHFFVTEFCFSTEKEAQFVNELLKSMKNKTDAKMKKAYTFIYANKVLLVTINRAMASGVIESFREEMQAEAMGIK